MASRFIAMEEDEQMAQRASDNPPQAGIRSATCLPRLFDQRPSPATAPSPVCLLARPQRSRLVLYPPPTVSCV